MPLPACLLHCNGGHVEIGLAPRPKNTTTAAGCGLEYHGYQCRGHRTLRVAGRGGWRAAFACVPARAAGKDHGGHPDVTRGGGGGLGIPMASPRICTARPALRPAFVTKVELMSILAAQPPAPPPPGPPGVPRGPGMRVGPERTGNHGVGRLARHRYSPCGMRASLVHHFARPDRVRTPICVLNSS